MSTPKLQADTMTIAFCRDLVLHAQMTVEHVRKHFTTSQSLYNIEPQLLRERNDLAEAATIIDGLLRWSQDQAVQLLDREQGAAHLANSGPQRVRTAVE